MSLIKSYPTLGALVSATELVLLAWVLTPHSLNSLSIHKRTHSNTVLLFSVVQLRPQQHFQPQQQLPQTLLLELQASQVTLVPTTSPLMLTPFPGTICSATLLPLQEQSVSDSVVFNQLQPGTSITFSSTTTTKFNSALVSWVSVF